MTSTRCSTLHDIHAPASDKLNGQWHKGYSLPTSETVAFYCGGWYASKPGEKCVLGPFKTRGEALCK